MFKLLLKNDDQKVHQYQQNKQRPLNSTPITEHKHIMPYIGFWKFRFWFGTTTWMWLC